MESSDQISERAIALATEDNRDGAANELIRLADNQISALEGARDILVRRIRLRSDDYAATKGLTLINQAIAKVGWPDPVEWKPRKWRIPR